MLLNKKKHGCTDNIFFGGAQSLQCEFPVNFSGSRWEGMDRSFAAL